MRPLDENLTKDWPVKWLDLLSGCLDGLMVVVDDLPDLQTGVHAGQWGVAEAQDETVIVQLLLLLLLLLLLTHSLAAFVRKNVKNVFV